MSDVENHESEWSKKPYAWCLDCLQPVYVPPYPVHDGAKNRVLIRCRRCEVRQLLERFMHLLTIKPTAKVFETNAEDDE